LRDAVLQFNADSGSADDTILLQSGTYALTIANSGGQHETAGLSGDLNLTSASHRWIIQGAGSSGPNATIIDAGQLQDRVFDIVMPGTQVVFKDLIIQGGLAQDDGSNGALAGKTDALGGGIFNNGGDITLDHVILQNNVARGGWALGGTSETATMLAAVVFSRLAACLPSSIRRFRGALCAVAAAPTHCVPVRAPAATAGVRKAAASTPLVARLASATQPFPRTLPPAATEGPAPESLASAG
jgi:hypothetical protein